MITVMYSVPVAAAVGIAVPSAVVTSEVGRVREMKVSPREC